MVATFRSRILSATLISYRTTVLPCLRSSVQYSGHRIDTNSLIAAAVLLRGADVMAAAAQVVKDLRRKARLGNGGAAVGAGGFAGRCRGAEVLDARGFAGLLHVH